MQIALDTVVYIILSLMLFSLVIAFLPRVEDLGNAFVREKIKLTKEEAMNEIINVYLDKKNSSTIFLKEEITKEELEKMLNNSGLSNISIDFNSTSTLTITKVDGEVVING